jgi:CRISPR-associated protein Cmr2
MPNHNLSITIGPVYKTLKQARSVREIWASSYFFSALMREILKEAHAHFGNPVSPTLLPDTSHRFGAGIYPDRAFWSINNSEKKKELVTVWKKAVKNLAGKWGIPENQILDYAYCYGHLLSAPATNNSQILAANKALDDLELEEFIHNPSQEIIEEFVSVIQKMYKDGHQQNQQSIFEKYACNNESLRRLPSLIEIATRDLKPLNQAAYTKLVTEPINTRVCNLINSKRTEYNKAEQEEQDAIIAKLKKEFKTAFKFRHKYIVFIKADGDYMGSTLGKIGNDADKIKTFSDLLSGFAGDAVEIAHKYGSVPIYAGGDDLLLTLPLANANPDTIQQSGANLFELIDKLDSKFPSDDFSSLADRAYQPTMSYGISVCYYKYPMDEILSAADTALNQHAKNYPGKNAVSFSLRKHSGQTITATFGKKEAYKKFVAMLSKYGKFNDDAFLSGLMYKLEGLNLLLTDAVINGRLEYLFKNQFNEAGHTGKYKTVLEDARKLFLQFYTEALANAANSEPPVTNEEHAARALGQLFACLRFIQFFNQEDHE